MYECDELLVDLRNDDLGFSGELLQTFTIFFSMSSKYFKYLMSYWSSS